MEWGKKNDTGSIVPILTVMRGREQNVKKVINCAIKNMVEETKEFHISTQDGHRIQTLGKVSGGT